MDLGKTSRFTYAMAAQLPKFLPNEFAKVSLLALEDMRRRTTFLRLMVLHYLICLSIEHALASYSRNSQEQKFTVSDNLDDSFKYS